MGLTENKKILSKRRKKMENLVIDNCKDCGKGIGQWTIEYITENPNGSDMAREQAWLRHVSGECEFSWKHDHVLHCQECGEEIGRWDREYVTSNPTGLDMAEGMAMERHAQDCKVAWERWEGQMMGYLEGTGIGLNSIHIISKELVKKGYVNKLLDMPVSPYGDIDYRGLIEDGIAEFLGFESIEAMKHHIFNGLECQEDPFEEIGEKLKNIGINIKVFNYHPSVYVDWEDSCLNITLSQDSVGIDYCM
jgi:hypothetical protein